MKLSSKKERELLDRIIAIKEYETQKKELESSINSMKDEIKEFMDKKNVAELNVDVYTIRYMDVSTDRFDSAGFKKTHEELYNQYLKTTTSKRFTIS